MSDRFRVILFISVVILFILSSYWFSQYFEQKKIKIEKGYHGIAAYQPLLALERLIKINRTVESIPQYFNLQHFASDDTLLLRGITNLTQQQIKNLLTWVDNGGFLILEAQYNVDKKKNKGLLSTLGIRVMGKKHLRDLKNNAEKTPLTLNEKSFDVLFSRHRHLDYSGDFKSLHLGGDAKEALHLITHAYGKGNVVVFSDLLFLQNRFISQADHADFIINLIDNKQPTGKIWLQYVSHFPSLWDILLDKAWPFLSTLAIIIFFWLWHTLPRFGPIIANPTRRRRSLLEHVYASGQFLWRHQQGHHLVEASRTLIINDIIQTYPQWATLKKEGQLQLLETTIDIPEAHLDIALYSMLHQQENSEQVLNYLNTLRNKL